MSLARDVPRAWATRVVLLCAALASFWWMGVFAYAVDAPHVSNEPDDDACAICHRTHTASSDTTWAPVTDPTDVRSALILGQFSGEGDTGLCFVCHGVDSLGSTLEVQTSFTSESSHTIAPDFASFGPQPMDCSSCHDSHGTARDEAGDPYAALLRSFSATSVGDAFFEGDVYCATCHAGTPQDTWDGLTVWGQTAHSTEITAPASGTGIVCSVCHAAHGSDNPPLIVERILPPAVSTTLTVPANNRWLCFTCHATSYATYPLGLTYQTSAHAASEASVVAIGEWASAEDTRTVGECQNCHNSMGTSDGAGGVVPKLAVAEGRSLCDRCHNAQSQDALDMAQFAFPDSESTKLELAVAWDAENLGGVLDRLAVWTQETTGTVPRALVGPRAYDLPGSAVDAAYGDINADNSGDIVIADDSAKQIVVFERTPLQTIASATYSVDATPTFVGIGDLIVDNTGRPEIMVVSRLEIAPYTSRLDVYRFTSAGSALTRVFSNQTLGDDASGLAVGDIRNGPHPDAVITCMGDDSLRVFSESVSTPGTLATGAYATRRDPRGPSIGDADAGSSGNEVAVANSGESLGTLSIFGGAGTLLASYDATVSAGARAWDTVIADVLPNRAGAETAVALRHATGASGINVFPRAAGSGLGARQSYNTGLYYQTGSLAAGDVDSDTESELVVGNAGTWANLGASPTAPSVQVFSADGAGTALNVLPVLLGSEGVELAGGPPALLPVDIGPLGESRHPVSVATESHNSTEVPSFTARHVECSDCHNVHEATSTVPAQGAPLRYGEIKGSWGVSVLNGPGAGVISYTEKRGVSYEYEMCFKCHSGWWSDDDGGVITDYGVDIAALVDTRNPSFHAIETSTTPSTAVSGTFETGYSNSTVLYCTSCHGNGDPTEPQGPHSSTYAPLQRFPFYGVGPDAAGYICYQCHKVDVYRTGTLDDVLNSTTYSNFYDTTMLTTSGSEGRLHKLHVADKGFSCGTCHQNHGSRLDAYLLREGLDWVDAPNGGACYTPCHSGSTVNVYSRLTATTAPSSITEVVGSGLTGDVTSLASEDGTYVTLNEVGGTPGLDLEITFTGVTYTPTAFKLYGRYAGNSGHRLYIEAWDYNASSWVRIAPLPYSAVNTEEAYPLADSRFVSAGDQVRIRAYHESPGDTAHMLWLDRAWLLQ